MNEDKEFRDWINSDKKLMSEMFSGKLLENTPKKEIYRYFQVLAKIVNESPNRYIYAHSTIQNIIIDYFHTIGWDAGAEIPFGDLDSRYRFDVMAQHGAKTIVVEVKPDVTTRDMGQVMGYVHDIEKKFKKARVFLGTDILNFGTVLGGGEVTDMIMEAAKNHGLGVIFATKDDCWPVPAEFLFV